MKNYKMMIIDDNSINRAIIKNMFINKYEIDEFINGEEALNSITYEEKYDIILLDLSMPVMDGYQFLENVFTKFPELLTPIVVISADDSLSSAKKALEFGAIEYISHPINSDIIRLKINNIVKSYKLLLDKIKDSTNESVYYDGLTTLLNRGKSEELIVEYLNKHPEKKSAFIIFDVDNFKLYNDTNGHIIGDSILREVGTVLKKTFIHDGIVSRFGGDEFVVLMENVESVESITSKVIDINKALQKIDKKIIPGTVTLSVGISYGENKYFSQMYKEADDALYISKVNGKNQYSFFGREKNDISEIIDSKEVSIISITQNRDVKEMISSICISNQYGDISLNSPFELDKIKENLRTKKCLLFIDVSENNKHEELISHISKQERIFPLVAMVKEANIKQIHDFMKIEIIDLLTYPISPRNLNVRLEKVISKLNYVN